MLRLLAKNSIAVVAVNLVLCLCLQGAAPKGWLLAGSNPADYETGIDPKTVHDGHPSAYLKAIHTNQGFGTLMQEIGAENYLGKRVRLSAHLKSENVEAWAALWLRVDKGSAAVAFDNMQNRPIKGTNDWRNYQVVLDVPSDATGIAFGALLAGNGNIWVSDPKFEVVASDVPTTVPAQPKRPSAPVNLGFEN
jgi:hypothetical protein